MVAQRVPHQQNLTAAGVCAVLHPDDVPCAGNNQCLPKLLSKLIIKLAALQQLELDWYRHMHMGVHAWCLMSLRLSCGLPSHVGPITVAVTCQSHALHMQWLFFCQQQSINARGATQSL